MSKAALAIIPALCPPDSPRGGKVETTFSIVRPDGKVPTFPIVKRVSGARGSAEVVVERDGVATLRMKVDAPQGGSTTRYVASVLIAGYRDNEPNNVLTKIVAHSLTVGSNLFGTAKKDRTWLIPRVRPKDADGIRYVKIALERDKSEKDGLEQFVELCKKLGDGWDAANSLYEKVKNSELGQDAAVALSM
jgi:hypothetical protein